MATQVRWASETEVVRRIEAEWKSFADSPQFRQRLEAWGREDPRLAFENGAQLLEAAQRRDPPSWAERDRVLAALLERYDHDPVARRVALQVVLPQVKNVINVVQGWDTEERAARVVATAVDVLAYCASEPTKTRPNFRVFANTRRRVLRAAIRDRAEPLEFFPYVSQLEDHTPLGSTTPDEEQQRLDDLVEWVRDRARLREDTARLVVLTRAGKLSVSDLASLAEVSPQTIRQQRLRAEQRLRRSLSMTR